MIYPQLVPEWMCTTPCHITICTGTLSEDGEPIVILDKDLKCNFQDKATFVYGSQTAETVITGECLFNGDIAPEISDISSGKVNIFGQEREISSGQKNRNLDGTVNYTRIIIK